MQKPWTGSEIRQSFIDYFVERGHRFVPSSSLVPGGDQTLLFTNAGMVQFKDVFLGTDTREYIRAANSQKCMRVAGKHNDLDDVGRDDTHHTFFEMLGNWSFGDYYKKDAIEWAWDLLTSRWGLDKNRLYMTCFKDERGEIEADLEAYQEWGKQAGIEPSHILFFGRKENFWEMADTGPCGPCSEIHYDLGKESCNRKSEPGHVCSVNGNCQRFVELWNLVFIQYNRINPEKLEPLAAKHVDTGMGLDRIVSVLQCASSNYRTDLLFPIVQKVQEITGQTEDQRDENFTPFRVITDHSRAAAFLIADGVTPGNVGRNYICRMIIRRAFLFGGKLGIKTPFLFKVAEKVIENYGGFYPELINNQITIINNIKREEERFISTVENGLSQLNELVEETVRQKKKTIDGKAAFELYATHGLPMEITKDITREQGFVVDEAGFALAMEDHRVKSGAGKGFEALGLNLLEFYQGLYKELVETGSLPPQGVVSNPYEKMEIPGKVIGLIKDGESVTTANEGDIVEFIVPETCFYMESGGQVSDTGWITSNEPEDWQIEVFDVKKPAAGLVTHRGVVKTGKPQRGDDVVIKVDAGKRRDIMRNHTATHLLHRELRKILGEHARQAGSLVAPDKLRFDFSNPGPVSLSQLELVQDNVNKLIHDDYELDIESKLIGEALAEGAMALFGEKYGETVRTIQIGGEEKISYELCGGTHVERTSDIGLFLITSESSVAAGTRRIEAVTGRRAYELVKERFSTLKNAANTLETNQLEVPAFIESMQTELVQLRSENHRLRSKIALKAFENELSAFKPGGRIPVLSKNILMADVETLREMSDYFRQKVDSGVIILGSVIDGKPMIVSAVTEDLVKSGIHAGKIVKEISKLIDGSGGGRPNFAQAGGKNIEGLEDALAKAQQIIDGMYA